MCCVRMLLTSVCSQQTGGVEAWVYWWAARYFGGFCRDWIVLVSWTLLPCYNLALWMPVVEIQVLEFLSVWIGIGSSWSPFVLTAVSSLCRHRWDELRALLLFRLKQVWLPASAIMNLSLLVLCMRRIGDVDFLCRMCVCPCWEFKLWCFLANGSWEPRLCIKRDALTWCVDSGTARFL